MLINLKFNPNYYPSVARVDSSLIESTYILPETLKLAKRTSSTTGLDIMGGCDRYRLSSWNAVTYPSDH